MNPTLGMIRSTAATRAETSQTQRHYLRPVAPLNAARTAQAHRPYHFNARIVHERRHRSKSECKESTQGCANPKYHAGS